VARYAGGRHSTRQDPKHEDNMDPRRFAQKRLERKDAAPGRAPRCQIMWRSRGLISTLATTNPETSSGTRARSRGGRGSSGDHERDHDASSTGCERRCGPVFLRLVKAALTSSRRRSR
jgi:hypothetical protein